MEEYNMVVKVNYGDTLRRFTAYVNEGLGVMDLNMNVLRAKSLNFFNLSLETDLTFTYVDEDGDVVTLGDDNDLRDAVIGQHLNPLRITVLSKASKTEASDPKSQSESSASTQATPLRIEPPFPINAGVENALKSVPEPFRNALLKLYSDLVSKAASSAPVITELVEYYSMLGALIPNQDGATSSTPMDLNVSAGFDASIDPVDIPKQKPNSSSVEQVSGDDQKGYDDGNSTRGLRTSAPGVTPVDLNLNPPREDTPLSGNAAAAVSSVTPNVNDLMGLNPYPSQASGFAKQSVPKYDATYVLSGENIIQSPPSVAKWKFPGVVTEPYASNIAHDGLHPTGCPFKKSSSHYDGILRTFHRGIGCDGCGMIPIMGPRFKSKVKDDYDLCNFCFSEMGNEADYTRIDRPSYQSPRMFYPHPRFHGPSSHAIRGCGMKPSRPKLESRFIQDVTILDGTLIVPNTPFSKIWRMRNNGTLAWPRGTQLVWIGGDRLGDRVSVELEIPANGCAVNAELDISVDFIAPSCSGRYISYWRMASPSGQKFGQRVWVLIQVDTGLSSLSDSFRTGLNLNLPPESNGQKGKGKIVDINVKPVDCNPFIPDASHPKQATAELVKPLVDEPRIRREGFDFQVDNGSMAGGGNGVPPASEVSVPVLYPIIDLSEPAPVVEMQAPPPVVTNRDTVEQALLKELEEMGFKQTDLNKEVLRKNEYDMEQSVEDLCGFAEWDPILGELQEMGFSDRQRNKRLLIKNGGSIKKVVLDLIAGEKA
ncbi:protein NBR1 [Cinnamomum micranthum f. kanehirae]|uniref:Protein NBR1 n=1 Tax=Cinnamomum micranthum f. kanehirae TaxID=337451 RepID=A0A3S3LZI0_9MAGN|nr:protein NBR1 [Cinnamomum micranthum f. kanehirae]